MAIVVASSSTATSSDAGAVAPLIMNEAVVAASIGDFELRCNTVVDEFQGGEPAHCPASTILSCVLPHAALKIIVGRQAHFVSASVPT